MLLLPELDLLPELGLLSELGRRCCNKILD